jgi:DNA polymerase
MQIVTLDFETFYSKEYTLNKLTTEAYVRDPRFEPHGCAVRSPDGTTGWIHALDLRRFFSKVDWSKLAILHHHAHFDGLALSHYYRVKPKAWLDTLSMSRLVHGNHIKNGLDSLAKHYGLPAKSVPYNAFKGKHWNELSGVTQEMLMRGGMHDVGLTYELFTRMLPFVPDEELRLIDLTVRMFVEPALHGDVTKLRELIKTEGLRKTELLAELKLQPEDLQSAEKFATLLRAEGLNIPTKETDKGTVYCFARTDKFMQEVVLEHPNPTISALGEARLGIKSSIEQTRAGRIADMADRGQLPVYLTYCGAHTTRWSGGDRVNWQNIKRGSAIRSSIRAPAGYKLVKADKSQVECRFLNFLAEQDSVIERFRRKEDPYTAIASAVYGEDVYKPTKDDPRYAEMLAKRGTGKQLELSCGYGAGAQTIKITAARGTYGPPVSIDDVTALAWRNVYRKTHLQVVDYWYEAEQLFDKLEQKQTFSWSIFECRGGAIYLPNGTALQYPDIKFTSDGWSYQSRYGRRRLWGGFLVENLIQAVSRVDMGQCMLRLASDYRIVLMEHDAVGVLVREQTAEQDLQVILAEMRRPPAWLPDIPLDAEATMGETYS